VDAGQLAGVGDGSATESSRIQLQDSCRSSGIKSAGMVPDSGGSSVRNTFGRGKRRAAPSRNYWPCSIARGWPTMLTLGSGNADAR
jgi:hypothetical protein